MYFFSLALLMIFSGGFLNFFIFYFLMEWSYVYFLMIFFVVSLVIFLYSLYYLGSSIWVSYYLILLFSFISVMLFLILCSPSLNLIIFWDLLGITSFFLVIFYSNWDSLSGGLNTLLCNHLGDLFLIILISQSLMSQNCWKLIGYFFLFFMVGAAFTKSAQGPFMMWLPMAMSAPTPISSLVHSSTLVTGGLFLFYLFYWLVQFIFILMLGLGSFLISGLISIFEKDLKKLIALSTLSQISFCMFVIIMFYFLNSFFHMSSHAIFKSCLFMQVGVMIYHSLGTQEGRLLKNLGLIYQLLMLVSAISLCGLMFFSGMFTKDLILLSVSGNFLSLLIFSMFFLSVTMTFFYSVIMIKNLLLDVDYMSVNSLNSSTPILVFFMIFIFGSLVTNMMMIFSPSFFENYFIWLLIYFFLSFLLLKMKESIFYILVLVYFFKFNKFLYTNMMKVDFFINFGFIFMINFFNSVKNYLFSFFIFSMLVMMSLMLVFI